MKRSLRSGLAGLALVAAAVGGGCRQRAAPPADAGPTAGAMPADASTVPPPAARGKQIAILYASDLGAEIEACSCSVPLGGLARRATQLDRARGASDAAVVLDAGDLLQPAAARVAGHPPPDRGEVERRARLMAAAFARMGTTAMTPGERDLALGIPLLKQLAKQEQLPLVSANLRGPDGALLFDADRLIDAGGLKLGIFGVTMATTADDAAAWRAAGIEARDPAAAAREAASALRARGAQVVIALLHLPNPAEARRLLEAAPGIDWAVVGHAGMRLESPEKAGQTRMLAALAEGKELGRLDLHVVGGSVSFADRGERAELAAVLADHRRQLVDYDKPVGEIDPAALAEYHAQRRRDLAQAIAREQAALERLPRVLAGSWFENSLIPLDAATPDQAEVATLVAAYKNRKRQQPPPARTIREPRHPAP